MVPAPISSTGTARAAPRARGDGPPYEIWLAPAAPGWVNPSGWRDPRGGLGVVLYVLPVSEMHIREPGLVVVDVAAADAEPPSLSSGCSPAGGRQ
ncbi:DUF6207 family protein [Streptomyces eurythermus]